MQAIEGIKFIKQSVITIRAIIYGQSCKVEVWKVYRNTGEILVYIHSYLKLIPSVGMNELVLNNVPYLQFWMINLWVNLMFNFGVSGMWTRLEWWNLLKSRQFDTAIQKSNISNSQKLELFLILKHGKSANISTFIKLCLWHLICQIFIFIIVIGKHI